MYKQPIVLVSINIQNTNEFYWIMHIIKKFRMYIWNDFGSQYYNLIKRKKKKVFNINTYCYDYKLLYFKILH